MSTFNYPATVTVAPQVSLTGTIGTQTAGAYSTGDFVGTKMELAGALRVDGGSGWIQRVTITSKAVQTGAFEVWFFNADPSATTFTDNAVADINDADLLKVIGAVSCSDVKSLSGSSVHQWMGNLAFGASSGTTIYAVIVTRSAHTQGSTSDLQITIRILQN